MKCGRKVPSRKQMLAARYLVIDKLPADEALRRAGYKSRSGGWVEFETITGLRKAVEEVKRCPKKQKT